MKIAFITGGLMPGQNGVGDYTRILAGELIRLGHSAAIIGLNDSEVSLPFVGCQQSDEISMPAVRLPREMNWKDRRKITLDWLDSQKPDWISLQFVCYSFHPKGMIHGLAGKMAPLLQSRNLHVMFHEIWLCKEVGWGWDQSAIGTVQRHLIKRFIHETKPKVMHTSNALYAALLKRTGIQADELGLFGNIPVLRQPGDEWITSQLRKVLGEHFVRDEFMLLGFFGAIHEQWPPEPLLGQVHRAAEAIGKKAMILSIGRIGASGLNMWNRLARDYADRFHFLRLGEQSQEHISEYLSYLDYGIATTPQSIIGKSGTVASMLEHGLPVIVNRLNGSGTDESHTKHDPLLLAGDRQIEERLKAGVVKGPHGSRRQSIANELLASLHSVSIV